MIDFVGDYALYFYLIMAASTGWLAERMERKPFGWFVYGLFVWPIALIHLGILGLSDRTGK